MSRPRRIALAFAACLALALAPTAAADGAYKVLVVHVPGDAVAVFVTDPDDAPVPGVTFTARDAAGERWQRAGTTGDDGRWRFDLPARGPLMISATLAGMPVEARLEDGGEVDGLPELTRIVLQPPTAESSWQGQPISLSLRDADLRETLRSLAKIGGFNLVLDEAVEGAVTLELEDVPLDQAIAAILRTHNLGMEVTGRGWRVTAGGG